MKLHAMLLLAVLFALARKANAASPGKAQPLPITGARIVSVATETQLQTAMGKLQSGDTILLGDGTYNLTSTTRAEPFATILSALSRD